jgi:uncharacterized Zn ribbon protein
VLHRIENPAGQHALYDNIKNHPEQMIGAVVHQEGFLSTTMNPDFSLWYTPSEPPFRWHYVTPAGTHGIYMDTEEYSTEQEILLQAGTRVRIDKIVLPPDRRRVARAYAGDINATVVEQKPKVAAVVEQINKFHDLTAAEKWVVDSKLARPLVDSQAEAKHAAKYMAEYKTINSVLRDHIPSDPAALKATEAVTKKLDKILERSVLPEGVMVHRTVNLSGAGRALQPLQDALMAHRLGGRISDRAYVSTSLVAPPVSTTPGDVQLHIKVPKGTHAAYLGNGELLLPRGSSMVITKVQGREVWVELRPQAEPPPDFSTVVETGPGPATIKGGVVVDPGAAVVGAGGVHGTYTGFKIAGKIKVVGPGGFPEMWTASHVELMTVDKYGTQVSAGDTVTYDNKLWGVASTTGNGQATIVGLGHPGHGNVKTTELWVGSHVDHAPLTPAPVVKDKYGAVLTVGCYVTYHNKLWKINATHPDQMIDMTADGSNQHSTVFADTVELGNTVEAHADAVTAVPDMHGDLFYVGSTVTYGEKLYKVVDILMPAQQVKLQDINNPAQYTSTASNHVWFGEHTHPVPKDSHGSELLVGDVVTYGNKLHTVKAIVDSHNIVIHASTASTVVSDQLVKASDVWLGEHAAVVPAVTHGDSQGQAIHMGSYVKYLGFTGAGPYWVVKGLWADNKLKLKNTTTGDIASSVDADDVTVVSATEAGPVVAAGPPKDHLGHVLKVGDLVTYDNKLWTIINMLPDGLLDLAGAAGNPTIGVEAAPVDVAKGNQLPIPHATTTDHEGNVLHVGDKVTLLWNGKRYKIEAINQGKMLLKALTPLPDQHDVTGNEVLKVALTSH